MPLDGERESFDALRDRIASVGRWDDVALALDEFAAAGGDRDAAEEALVESGDISRIACFVRSQCVVGNDKSVTIGDIYDAWAKFTGDSFPGNSSHLGKNIRDSGVSIRRSVCERNGRRTGIYVGIGLKSKPAALPIRQFEDGRVGGYPNRYTFRLPDQIADHLDGHFVKMAKLSENSWRLIPGATTGTRVIAQQGKRRRSIIVNVPSNDDLFSSSPCNMSIDVDGSVLVDCPEKFASGWYAPEQPEQRDVPTKQLILHQPPDLRRIIEIRDEFLEEIDALRKLGITISIDPETLELAFKI